MYYFLHPRFFLERRLPTATCRTFVEGFINWPEVKVEQRLGHSKGGCNVRIRMEYNVLVGVC